MALAEGWRLRLFPSKPAAVPVEALSSLRHASAYTLAIAVRWLPVRLNARVGGMVEAGKDSASPLIHLKVGACTEVGARNVGGCGDDAATDCLEPTLDALPSVGGHDEAAMLPLVSDCKYPPARKRSAAIPVSVARTHRKDLSIDLMCFRRLSEVFLLPSVERGSKCPASSLNHILAVLPCPICIVGCPGRTTKIVMLRTCASASISTSPAHCLSRRIPLMSSPT